jgi:hypothetical protein
MKKTKLSVGILAFIGLAAINFTQSENYFLSKAVASSSSSSISGTSTSSTSFKNEEFGYNPICIPCNFPIESKTQITCGKIVKGGKQKDCSNSDC